MKTKLEKAVEVIGQDHELTGYASEAYTITFYDNKIVIQGYFLIDESFEYSFKGTNRKFYKKTISKEGLNFEIVASV